MTIDKARQKQKLARRHRRLAAFVSAWLAVLAISGVAINHAHEIGLDRIPVPMRVQKLIYGIEADGENYCDSVKSIGEDCGDIYARLSLDTGELLIGQNSIFILDLQGRLIEKIGAGHFGLTGFEAVLHRGSHIFLKDDQRVIQTGPDLLDREEVDAGSMAALNAGDWKARNDSAELISWERLMLDLHAARFLGPLAKWFNDLMAGLILFLALSGIWLFYHKRSGNGG
jgi:hypothetical protein